MDTAKAVDSGHAFPSVASGFIPSIVASVCIEGCDTDISIMEFTDKLFIVVSQYKKLGTLVLVTKDAANCDDPQTLVYTAKVLFGKDEAEVEATAKNIAKTIKTSKTVLLSLALKKFSPTIVRSIVSAVATQLSALSSPMHQNPCNT
ncbi:proteasome assembly chaperone 3 [Rhipicephalus sanguineus]|uniref:proteasome assembly chaperone 3 n=1 Tax=Rhipicephalus sanguineus TaxID=34632 RepID=UPI0018932E35|nr:proteasome assembly chaperone 3 [Rhipicephalus sanguineus]